jgi:DNA primase/RecA-family ATPase
LAKALLEGKRTTMHALDFNDDEEVKRLGVDELKNRLLLRLPDALRYLFPQGKVEKNTFVIGDVQGTKGNSLNVELTGLKAGLWHDFATGEGGDIIDLWGAANGLDSKDKNDFRKVMESIEEWIGDKANRLLKNSPTDKVAKFQSSPLGIATATYYYRDLNDNIIATISRYDTEDGKEFRPWDAKMRVYRMPNPRPLYNQGGIFKAHEIVLVEGEKCADALNRLGICVTTSMGGANAPIEKTDWEPLKNKRVILWPDNDEPGRQYADKVSLKLKDIGVREIAMLNVPSHKPKGWDAADAIKEGIDVKGFLRDFSYPVDFSQMEKELPAEDTAMPFGISEVATNVATNLSPAVETESSESDILLHWLRNVWPSKTTEPNLITLRDVCKFGTRKVRDKRKAVESLENQGHLTKVNSKKNTWQINATLSAISPSANADNFADASLFADNFVDIEKNTDNEHEEGEYMGSKLDIDDSPTFDDLIGPRVLVPGGTLVFAGAPKVGKTDFLLNLLIHLSGGVSFLGLCPPRPLKIYYLQLEIDYHYIKERYQEAVKNSGLDDDVLNLAGNNLCITKKHFMLLTEAGVKTLAEKINRKFRGHQVDIIVIDPLRNVYSGRNENDNVEMLGFLQNRIEGLRQLVNPNAGMILVHHTRKINKKAIEEDPFQSLSGAGSLRGYYSGCMLMHRPDEHQSVRHLMFELRNGKSIPTKLVDKINDRWQEIEFHSERLIRKEYGQKLDAERDRQTDVLLQLLTSEALNGKLYTPTQFAQFFDGQAGLGAKNTIHRRLDMLATKGFIKFNKDDYKVQGSKTGVMCVEDMLIPAGEQIDEDTGERIEMMKKVLPTHFKQRNTGIILPVENPEIWVYANSDK